LSLFKEALLRKTAQGDDCSVLENEIKRLLHAPFSVCMPQGRVGIYLAVKATIRPGQKVILSPYTVADVINMVLCAGGIPVFADVERQTCNIDPDEVSSLIDRDTGAVLTTHLHGLSCSMDRIMFICRKHGVPVIEDVAQAFGARYNGKWLGSLGDVGVYSFGRYKHLTSFYGGMLVTHHERIYRKIHDELNTYPYMEAAVLAKRATGCLARDIATSPPIFQAGIYELIRFGHLYSIRSINRFVETELDLNRKEKIPDNYLRKMTPAQARLVLSGLGNVEKDIHTRIKYAQIYHETLAEIPQLILPPWKADGSHAYTAFPVQYSERNILVRWLMHRRRDIGVQHLKNCADLPAFARYYRDCPRTRVAAKEVILLPTYPRYSEREVRRNSRLIREFFTK
jgi:dTDP-4-amino-4,6-dideoxygalactose transaminase